jgi:hypothetical protein
MKYILLLLVLIASLTSCRDFKEKTIHTTEEFSLRQLVQNEETSQHASASYFLFMGGYHSSTTTQNKLKVFAKVDGMYQFINMDLEDVRIKIVDSTLTPSIQVVYKSRYDDLTNERILNGGAWIRYYIVNVPEKYLPKRLIPIDITD